MDHPHRKRLGQYFTLPSVVDFALDALEWLGDAQAPEARRVIDPACGDGAFLRRVLDRRLALSRNLWGIDRDPALETLWGETGLRAEGGPHMLCADGLLGTQAVPEAAFHWVVGNPPYAGEGLKQASPGELGQIADRFELPALRHRKLISAPEDCRRMPVEVLFLERFVQLCAPGGLVAVVLPVGLFANARWRFVRDWLLVRCTVEGVVGLPRSAFRHAGITARTCLGFLRKCPAQGGHRVFLAEASQVGADPEGNDLPGLLAAWKDGSELSDECLPWQAARRDLDAFSASQ